MGEVVWTHAFGGLSFLTGAAGRQSGYTGGGKGKPWMGTGCRDGADSGGRTQDRAKRPAPDGAEHSPARRRTCSLHRQQF